jgi:hypothetical protein
MLMRMMIATTKSDLLDLLDNHIPFLFHFAAMDDVQLDSVLAVDTPVATAQPPPPASSTRRDTFSTVPWEQVTWEHVTKNADGRASAVCGVLLSSLTTKILRVICGRLAIRGVKNTKKTEMVDKVVSNYSSWKAYQRFANKHNTTKQEYDANHPCHHDNTDSTAEGNSVLISIDEHSFL